MTVKVLVTQIGQQLIASVQQVENTESKEIVGYLLSEPRTVNYNQDDNGNLGVNFGSYCPVSVDTEFSMRAEHVVAILEPRPDVLEGYNAAVAPPAAPEAPETVVTEAPPVDPTEAEAFAQEAVEPKAQEGITPAPTAPVNDEPSTDSTEVGTNPGLTE